MLKTQFAPVSRRSCLIYLHLTKAIIALLTLMTIGADACPAEPNQSPIQYEEGIVYVERENMKIKLDMARPKQSTEPRPALIFIHGGSWQHIGRYQFRGEIKEAAQQGFVAVTIDHRLTEEEDESGKPLYPWPACFRDTAAAVRFLRAHAEQYNIDKNHIGITGHSSGGHLALMLATASDRLKNKNLSVWPNQSSAVQAAVSLSAPTDLKPFHKVDVTRPMLEDLLGGPPEDRPDIYRGASPIHHIDTSDPPMMLVHGVKDDVVPIKQARDFAKKLKKLGVTHKTLFMQDNGHIYGADAYLGQSLEFFNRHLKIKQ